MILSKVIQTIRLKRFPSGMSAAGRLLLRRKTNKQTNSDFTSCSLVFLEDKFRRDPPRCCFTFRSHGGGPRSHFSIFLNFFFLLFSCFPQLGVTPSSIKSLITRRSVYPVGEATFMFTSQKKKRKKKKREAFKSTPGRGGWT